MKKILLTVFVMAMAIGASAQEKNFIDQNYVEITGRADMEVTPDEIYLSITINEANTGRKTLAQVEKDMFNALRGVGVDLEKDLTVGDMASDLKTYLLKKNAVQTAKSYQLKVKTATQLSNVFGALANAGVSDANISRTEVSNIKDLRNEVRSKAVLAAKENAVVLAEALGQKVGKAIYIQDYGYSIRPYANVMMSRSAMADEAGVGAMPELDFQKTKIEQSVLVRFILE